MANSWLVSELCSRGGFDMNPWDHVDVPSLVEYKGYYLRISWGDFEIAKVKGFDRWSNSRVYHAIGPEVPTTVEEIEDILGKLNAT